MKILNMCAAVLTIAVTGLIGAAVETRPAPRTISLAAGDETLVFGKVASLDVVYRNKGPEPWVLPSPSDSQAVELHYRPAMSIERAQRYSLGRSISTTITGPGGQPSTVLIPPNPQNLSVPPGGEHKFTVPFERDWSGDVYVGRWTIWLVDGDAALESNRLNVALKLTVESVESCLAVAMDKTQPVIKRKWHSAWLKRIDPKLEIVWPADTAAPEEKATLEETAQRQLSRFRDYIRDKSNTPHVEANIARINRESGVE